MTIERTSPQLALDDREQETLEQWIPRPKSAQALARRARIILSCADGLANTVVAAQSGVSKPTVGKWRPRFLAQRLDGLPRVNHICRFGVNQFCRFTSSAWPRCWAALVR